MLAVGPVIQYEPEVGFNAGHGILLQEETLAVHVVGILHGLFLCAGGQEYKRNAFMPEEVVGIDDPLYLQAVQDGHVYVGDDEEGLFRGGSQVMQERFAVGKEPYIVGYDPLNYFLQYLLFVCIVLKKDDRAFNTCHNGEFWPQK